MTVTIDAPIATPANVAKAQPAQPAPSQANIDRAGTLDRRRQGIIGRVLELNTDGMESEFLRTMPSAHRQVLEAVVTPSGSLDKVSDVLGAIERQLVHHNKVNRESGENRRSAPVKAHTAYEPDSKALQLETLRRELMGRRAAFDRLVAKRIGAAAKNPKDETRQQQLKDLKSLERPVPPKASADLLERLERVLGMLEKEINAGRTVTASTSVRGQRPPRRGQNGWGQVRRPMTDDELAASEAALSAKTVKIGTPNAQPAGKSVTGRVIAKKKKPGKK